MGSKGSNTTTETKSYAADPRATAYASWLSGQGQNLPGQGDVPLQGVEGFNQDQYNAFQGVRNAQGAYNPYAQRAEALNAEYGRGLNTQGIQDMYSQLSAGPLAQLANQQQAQMGQATRNAVQSAGGTGASRIGVAQGNLANQQNLATGALQSGLLGQSINAYQNDLAMKGAAAAQEANLGFGQTAQNYNDLGQLYGIGSAQQGLGQSGLNALYQQQQGQYQNPYQNFQMQAGILGSLGQLYGGTTTSEKTVPEQGWAGTLLGAAGAGLGAYLGGPGGSAVGSKLGSYLGGNKGSGYYGGSPETNPNLRPYADGGAVGRPNPFAGGMGNSRSGLFDQMVRQYFSKYNPMSQTAGIKAGNPFGQFASQPQAPAMGGGFGMAPAPSQPQQPSGGAVSQPPQPASGGFGGFADGGEVDSFDDRFDIPAPDLYDPEIISARNSLRDAGYNSPSRTEPMSEGDDVAPPLPRPRPDDPTPVNPYSNPEVAMAYATGEGGGSRGLPPMPDTDFKAPERNPYGPVFAAIASALSKHGERTADGHLMSGTIFGQAARSAGAGLNAGLGAQAAGREEDRKNYNEKLRGETLYNQAAMARLPYEQMTEYQKGSLENQRAVAERGNWTYLGPSSTDPNKSVFMNSRTGETEERAGGVAAKPVNRPIPAALQKDLGQQAGINDQLMDLRGGFKDDFAGSGPGIVGDIKNYAARQFGIGNVDSANWWQEYQKYANTARNKLFGSALTATERGEWEKADINPGMQPDLIRKNMQKQNEIVQRAISKRAESLAKQGYSREAIEAEIGFPIGGIMQGAPAKGGEGGPPVSMLKEGVITTFKDGSSWTLRGGSAVKVGP